MHNVNGTTLTCTRGLNDNEQIGLETPYWTWRV